jgi:hypothetical protein
MNKETESKYNSSQGDESKYNSSQGAHRVKDNGSKWSSYVKQLPDGSFPFDEKMKKERPKEWEAMIVERLSWIRKDKEDVKAFRQTSSSRNFSKLEK